MGNEGLGPFSYLIVPEFYFFFFLGLLVLLYQLFYEHFFFTDFISTLSNLSFKLIYFTFVDIKLFAYIVRFFLDFTILGLRILDSC